jgi:hypothetical protein
MWEVLVNKKKKTGINIVTIRNKVLFEAVL